MKRSFVYYILLTGTLICVGFAISANGAQNNSLNSKSKAPIRTLWYPGPYDPNTASPAPVKTPIASPYGMPETYTTIPMDET